MLLFDWLVWSDLDGGYTRVKNSYSDSASSCAPRADSSCAYSGCCHIQIDAVFTVKHNFCYVSMGADSLQTSGGYMCSPGANQLKMGLFFKMMIAFIQFSLQGRGMPFACRACKADDDANRLLLGGALAAAGSTV